MAPLINLVFYILLATVSTSHVQKRSDDVSTGTLETDVIRLTNEMTALKAQLASQNQELAGLKTQLAAQANTLETYGKNVAFHAWGTTSPISTAAKGPIVLKGVKTNIGNAYNPQTGFFTAPVSGLYQFHATYMAVPPQEVHAVILVDSAVVAYSYSDSRHGKYVPVSLHATVHVNAGHTVHFNTWESNPVNVYGNQYTTFSGFLIRAD